MGYFLTASCFALLRVFVQNRFVKGKGSLNRVPGIAAAGAPHSLATCAPPATCHPPLGRALTGTIPPQKLSGSLLFLHNPLLCSKTPLPPPSLTASSFLVWEYQKAPWRGEAPRVSSLCTFCWGRRCERARSRARQRSGVGERLHLREAASPQHFGTCSILVARARFFW